MKKDGTRVTIFHCGTQWLDWQNSNCCRCKKSINQKNDMEHETTFDCDLEADLYYASMDDGTVSEEFAKRLGYTPQAYSWQCTEVDWTDEWKKECFERRHQERLFA